MNLIKTKIKNRDENNKKEQSLALYNVIKRVPFEYISMHLLQSIVIILYNLYPEY